MAPAFLAIENGWRRQARFILFWCLISLDDINFQVCDSFLFEIF